MMKKFFTLIILLALAPQSVFAASMTIEVDTGKENINALEGTMRLPLGLKVDSIYTGDSMVLIWITQPSLSDDGRTISFAGLTPGGVQGKYPIFALVGEFESTDINSVTFSGVKAYRHDGEGTIATVKLRVVSAESKTDDAPPESFEPVVSKSPEIYDGRPFVSFVAHDKITGVKRYEVSERFIFPPGESDWEVATSPYEARDDFAIKKVYVKAIDHEGNARVETVALPNRLYVLIFLAIIIVVLCIVVARRSRKRDSYLYSS